MAGLAQAIRLLVAHYGLAALFLLLVVEEAGVWLPLPGDVLIMYFGYQASRAHAPLLAALPVVGLVTAAVLCGSLVLYTVARRFRWRIRRLGRLLHLHERRLSRMEHWLQHWGALVIIPGRLVPGLRIPTTAVAGLFAVPLRRFVPAVTVAAVLWASLYVLLGAAGATLLALSPHVVPDEPSDWLLSALLSLVLLAGVVVLRQRHLFSQQH